MLVLTPRAVDGLDVGAIRRQLVSETVGTHVYVFADVESTNRVLRDLAEAGAREGAVVLAESQRAGRGRLDTTWFSPPGVNLYLSVLLRPAIAPAAAPIFSFIVSLALTEAIWALGIPASVKWPNDVMIAGRKVAGARLDLGIEGDRVTYVVAGVGVNVNILREELEEGLGAAAGEATSLREALGRAIDRNAFAASFLNLLEKWLGLYRTSGPEAILAAWGARDMLIGRRVAVNDDRDACVVGGVAGVDRCGLLLVDDDSGIRHRVVSGPVRVLAEAR